MSGSTRNAEELVDYLATVGERQGRAPMRREAADALVREGWAPSGVSVGGRYYANEEALAVTSEPKWPACSGWLPVGASYGHGCIGHERGA